MAECPRPFRIGRTVRTQKVIGVAVLFCLLFVSILGCRATTGTYAPLDLFSEMHYSPGVRSQEPPRLASPLGAVPVSGFEIDLAPPEYRDLAIPIDSSVENLLAGQELYRTNCSMCHGPLAAGDGPVGEFLSRDGYISPPDLTAPATVERTDGEIFGLITQGVYVMPKFKHLLSKEDRWMLVIHIREMQDR